MSADSNIVIVEDNKIIEEGLRKYIESIVHEKLNVVSYSDSQNALSFIRSNPVHLLITDIRMPILNGIELAKKTKLLYPSLKIIFISAFEEFDYAYEALHIGADDYLIKPIDMEKLKKLLIKLFPNIACDFTISHEAISEISKNILRQHSDNNIPNDFSNLVIRVIQAIENNYKNSDFNLDKIANLTFVTKGYISNQFKKETGLALGRFLSQYRLEKAKVFLETTNLKVKYISKSCGYNNVSLFCKNFKLLFDFNPSEVRNKDFEK